MKTRRALILSLAVCGAAVAATPWSLPFGKGFFSGRSALASALGWFTEPKVSYAMPRDGRVTLGLFDKSGRLLRWIIQDEFRRAGQRREHWDGLDQWGNPVPAGDYELKGICHDALTTDYKMTVCNPGTPPWPTPDGTGDWLSDEAAPQSVVTDGKWVYLAAPNSEKGFTVIAIDENGQKRWGSDKPRHSYKRSVSLALDGDYLYGLFSGVETPDADHNSDLGKAYGRAILFCYDKRTGKPARFSRWGDAEEVATWPYRNQVCWLWDLRNNHGFRPEVYGGQPRYACLDVGETTNALGLAAAGGKLWVALNYENKLLAADEATGKPTQQEIAVPAPTGLYSRDGFTGLAVSGTQVLAIDFQKKSVAPVITSGLVAPDSVTTDKQGNIYVSDWATSFQVKVFDAAGHFLRAIGKEGGRPWIGPWDKDGMLVPRGIAVTNDAKLWVAEDDNTPKRTSVWDASSGRFLRDYIGPAPYGGGNHVWIDPHDASEFNVEGTRFRVDLAKRTYTPEGIAYRRENRDDPFTPNGHNLGPTTQVRILYRGGAEYAVVNLLGGVVSILKRDGDVYHAVAAMGGVMKHGDKHLAGDGTGIIDWDSDIGHRVYNGFFPDCFRGHAGDDYSWVDRDGDGLVQPAEMNWVTATEGPYAPGAHGRMQGFWGLDISPDWTFFFLERFKDRQVIFRLNPDGWTPGGAPIYNLANARAIAFEDLRHSVHALHATSDGKLIVSYNFEDRRNTDAIQCFDGNGKSLWEIAMPRQLAGKNVHANNAVYDFQVRGLGDVVCTYLYHGSMRPFLLTSDGLYVGTLLDETLEARFFKAVGLPIQYYVCTMLDTAPVGPKALWSESSKYYYQSPDGKYYIVNGGNQAEHILEIGGLNGAERFEASLHLGANSP